VSRKVVPMRMSHKVVPPETQSFVFKSESRSGSRQQPDERMPRLPRNWTAPEAAHQACRWNRIGLPDQCDRCRQSAQSGELPARQHPKPAAAVTHVTDAPSLLDLWITAAAFARSHTVFFDNTTPSPFPTRLHLWLVADGASRWSLQAFADPPITPRLSAPCGQD